MKAIEPGFAESSAVTVRVTGTAKGELVAAPVTEMDALYTPGLNPAGFTDTETLADVAPLVGVTESQLPPDAVEGNREKPMFAAGEVEIVKFWEPGGLPPTWYAKLSDEGPTVYAAITCVTLSVTEIVRLLAVWLDVTLIEPVYDPAFKPAGFTETVNVAELIPLVGVTESQLPPELVDDVMLKLAPVAVIVSV